MNGFWTDEWFLVIVFFFPGTVVSFALNSAYSPKSFPKEITWKNFIRGPLSPKVTQLKVKFTFSGSQMMLLKQIKDFTCKPSGFGGRSDSFPLTHSPATFF